MIRGIDRKYRLSLIIGVTLVSVFLVFIFVGMLKEELTYDTTFTFVGRQGDNFIVKFYHDAEEKLPVDVDGIIDYDLSEDIAPRYEEVNLTVPLEGGDVPYFRLRVGPGPKVYEFGGDGGDGPVEVPVEKEAPLWMVLGVNPPTQGIPILNSTHGTNKTEENLTVYNQSTDDADGEVVKNIINWYKDGGSIMLLNMPFENNTANISNTTKDYSDYGNNGTEQGGVTWFKIHR